MIMLDDKPDLAALEASKQQYFGLLEEGITHEQGLEEPTTNFTQAKADYLGSSRPLRPLASSRRSSRASRTSLRNSMCCVTG